MGLSQIERCVQILLPYVRRENEALNHQIFGFASDKKQYYPYGAFVVRMLVLTRLQKLKIPLDCPSGAQHGIHMGCFVSHDVWKIGCNGESTRYNENHLQSVVVETLLGMVLEKSHRDLPRENTISQQRVLLLLQAL